MIDLSNMTTEMRNPETMMLDKMSSLEIVTVMNKEDEKIPRAVATVLPQIAQVADWVAEAFEAGGRLFYMGAGTSGRLGVLDASECPPTFGVPSGMVVGLIAGGDIALRNPVENAEDNKELGKEDLIRHKLDSRDVVVGIAASGRTPYVIGGLEYANKIGCRTVSVTCNTGSAMGQVSQLAIEASPGPEVLTGSTRLKSGTTQKLILNMITTTAMIRTGKVYENMMVDVVQSNEKLHSRAENIVMEITGIDRQDARLKINEADGSVKTAIVMVLAGCGRDEAVKRLADAGGHVREALWE